MGIYMGFSSGIHLWSCKGVGDARLRLLFRGSGRAAGAGGREPLCRMPGDCLGVKGERESWRD